MTQKLHLSIKPYIYGFVASVLLTLVAYILVTNYMNKSIVFSPEWVIGVVLVLAVSQLFIQLKYFLHLGSESGVRWNLIFFISTGSVILMIVLASLWIMSHLESNHMTPQQIEHKIIEKEGIHMPQ